MEIMNKQTHQSEVLAELIFNHGVKRMAEVGVWKGTTVNKILTNKDLHTLKEYWAIDPWLQMGPEHGHYHTRTQENWDEIYFFNCGLMCKFSQLRVLRLTSVEAATIFPADYFDLVFLDGPHFFESTLLDIKTWLPLIKPKGLLCGHDFNYTRSKEAAGAVRQVFGRDFKVYPAMVWVHGK